MPPRWTEEMEVTGGHVRAVRQMFKKFPLNLLNTFWVTGLYGFWHCHDEAVLLLPVGLDVYCKFHPEAPTEIHSMMQNSHFHDASENGLTVLPENPTTWQA
jgi:hypothetical protein